MSFAGDNDFLGFVRSKQQADQEEAMGLLDQAEEILIKSLEEETPGEDAVEKSSPWVAITEGKFGHGISVYKHKDGSTFWVTKGDAIAGWVEKRGKKWLSRPVGRDEWTGDSFQSAVSHIVDPKIKDDTNPPPGTGS